MCAAYSSFSTFAVLTTTFQLIALTSMFRISCSTDSSTAASRPSTYTQNYTMATIYTSDGEVIFPVTGSTARPKNSTTSGSLSTTTPADEVLEYETMWQNINGEMILKYGPPILLVLATVGNSMSVIVLQNPMFRKSSTSFIMSAVASVDMFVVLVGLLRQWIRYLFSIDIRDFTAAGCKIHIFLTYYLLQLSSWNLVLLTLERVVSVWMPFKCKEICSRRRIIAAFCGFALALGGLNLHFFFIFNLIDVTYEIPYNNGSVTYHQCHFYPQYNSFWFDVWYWIDAFTKDFVPFAIIFSGNVFIVTRIVIANRQRAGKMQAKEDKGKGRKVTSSTATLMAISFMFLILNIPTDVYFLGLGSGLLKDDMAEGTAIINLFYSCITILSYCNNAINFVMYFASGRKFRLAFIDTIMCRWGRSDPRASIAKSTMTQTRATAITATRMEDISMTTLSAAP